MCRPLTLGFQKRAGEDMTRGPGRHPNEIDEGAHNEGSVNDDAMASAARCAPQGARTRQAPPPMTTRQRPLPSMPEPMTRAPTKTRPGRAPRGARTRQASPPTTTRQRPPPRGARARQIAPRCTAEADEINEGTHNEGSLDNEAEASAARHAYSGPTHGQGRRHRQRGLRQGLRRQRGRAWVCERCLRR